MGNLFSFDVDSWAVKGILVIGLGVFAFGGYKYWQARSKTTKGSKGDQGDDDCIDLEQTPNPKSPRIVR